MHTQVDARGTTVTVGLNIDRINDVGSLPAIVTTAALEAQPSKSGRK